MTFAGNGQRKKKSGKVEIPICIEYFFARKGLTSWNLQNNLYYAREVLYSNTIRPMIIGGSHQKFTIFGNRGALRCLPRKSKNIYILKIYDFCQNVLEGFPFLNAQYLFGTYFKKILKMGFL